VVHTTVFGGAPFGKWQATEQLVGVGGVVAVFRSVIVPPAVVVPPANVNAYDGSKA
jgi:hypothetical protein